MDLTFIVPLRVESAERLENADASVAYLRKHLPEAAVLVVEHAPRTALAGRWSAAGVEHLFLESAEPFSKTAAINAGLLAVRTRYVCIYDADVLIARQAIVESLAYMERHRVAVVLPHNTIFLNVAGQTRAELVRTLDLAGIPFVAALTRPPPGADYSVRAIPSGVVVFEREVLLLCGGFNQRMHGYGWEDIEVLKRLNRLGFFHHVLGGYNIVHLDHPRTESSRPNDDHFRANQREMQHVLGLTMSAMVHYVCDSLRVLENQPPDSIRRRLAQRRSGRFRTLDFLRYANKKALNLVRIRGWIPYP